MTKRPDKIIKYLCIQKKQDGIFVDNNNKQLMKYYIEIPYWIGKAFDRNANKYARVEISSKILSLNEMRLNENTFRSEEYFKKIWQPRLKKIRKLNHNFIQTMPKKQNLNWFSSMDDYNNYHKELKKINEKYMKRLGVNMTNKEKIIYEFNYHNQDEITCPYCGFEHGDSSEEKKDSDVMVCHNCNEKFIWYRECTVIYNSEKTKKV